MLLLGKTVGDCGQGSDPHVPTCGARYRGECVVMVVALTSEYNKRGF